MWWYAGMCCALYSAFTEIRRTGKGKAADGGRGAQGQVREAEGACVHVCACMRVWKQKIPTRLIRKIALSDHHTIPSSSPDRSRACERVTCLLQPRRGSVGVRSADAVGSHARAHGHAQSGSATPLTSSRALPSCAAGLAAAPAPSRFCAGGI